MEKHGLLTRKSLSLFEKERAWHISRKGKNLNKSVYKNKIAETIKILLAMKAKNNTVTII